MKTLVKSLLALILAVTMIYMTVGCASPEANYSSDEETRARNMPNDVILITKTLDDGIILECIWAAGTGHRSGLECNWEGVNLQRELFNE